MTDRIAFAAPDINDSDIEAVTRVLRSGWLTTGRECQLLEEELAAYLGVPHVLTMSSCTAALETTYASLGLPAGARVGVPTWTFVASALAPARQGAVPVLLDVDRDTLNLCADSLARALGDGLDAVVATHFGGVALSKEIHDLCAEHDVPLIEDAAHAFGTSDHRGLISGQGTAGACFSFYATKNLSCGEGGALVTWDEELASFGRSFRLHGLSWDAWKRYQPGATSMYDLDMPGIKGNMSDVLAALARSQLARFDEMQSRRRAAALRYHENLATIPCTETVPSNHDDRSTDHLMVILLSEGVERQPFVTRLAKAGVPTSMHFQPLHHFRWFADHADLSVDGFPVADALSSRALSLPLHAGLGLADVDRVCSEVAAALS